MRSSSPPSALSARSVASMLAFALAGAQLACDSIALSLDDPTSVGAEMDRPYLEGDASVRELELVFAGLTDPDDDAGDPAARAVVTWDFGPDLVLQAWFFQTNFRLRLFVERLPGARLGVHPLSLRVRNAYGEFDLQGEFYLFP